MKKKQENKKNFTNNVPRGTNKNQSYENKIHYRIRRKNSKEVEIYVIEGTFAEAYKAAKLFMEKNYYIKSIREA